MLLASSSCVTSRLCARTALQIFNIHTGAQPDIFQGRGAFVDFGHFDKNFAKNARKKGPAGKNVRDFSPIYF